MQSNNEKKCLHPTSWWCKGNGIETESGLFCSCTCLRCLPEQKEEKCGCESNGQIISTANCPIHQGQVSITHPSGEEKCIRSCPWNVHNNIEKECECLSECSPNCGLSLSGKLVHDLTCPAHTHPTDTEAWKERVVNVCRAVEIPEDYITKICQIVFHERASRFQEGVEQERERIKKGILGLEQTQSSRHDWSISVEQIEAFFKLTK
jgi:hypothetical protein